MDLWYLRPSTILREVIVAKVDVNTALMVSKSKILLAIAALFLLLSSMFSCREPSQNETINSLNWIEDTTLYAQNYSLQYTHQGESRLLIFADASRRDTLSKLFKGNAKKVINSDYIHVSDSLYFASLASNYVGYLDALNQAQSIHFVDEIDYINSKRVLKRVEAGQIQECGGGEQLNYEMLLSSKPLILAYEIIGSSNPILERCKQLGLQTINCTDFKEQHPLGRAEWLKVFSWLTSCEQEGEALFNEIKEHYIQTQYFCTQIKQKPKVLVGNLFGGVWNVSGGNSFLAKLIKDAGGDYIFKDDTSKLNYVLSFEEIYRKAKNADVWLNPNIYTTLSQIESEDSRYGLFDAFKNGRVYNNNKIINTAGGNAIWEMGVVRPDIVLKDLAICFHPQYLKQETTIFYQQLE